MISAVRSPMSRLYLRLMYWTIASSILSPATRIDFESTMPASEITATSVVPPPMSTIMLPRRLGDRQAGADRRRHRLLDQVDLARRRRASAESRTARFSTSVMPDGTQMMMRGRTSVRRLCACWMK